jgi:hypothetical protein
MAIPWLIGAAVVGLVAALASDDSSEQAEKERQRSAQQERERRLAAEANARRQQAREAEAHRQEEVRQHNLRTSTENKIQALLNQYNIYNISQSQAIHFAIHNANTCKDFLQKAHINSRTHIDIRNKIFTHEQTLKEIDKLSAQLAQ